MDSNAAMAELIANGLVTLAAAFLGAWAAFRLESNSRNKDQEDEDVAAGNRALFTLTQMWSKLRQYQKEMIHAYRNQHDAWLNLPIGMPIRDSSIAFSMNELSFLLNAKPVAFMQVFLEADRFQMASKMVNQRIELVLSEVHPRMSAAGINVGEKQRAEVIEKIISNGVVHHLKSLTAGIIRNVDEDVISSFEAYTALRVALKEIYPKRKFLEFKKND